MEYGDVRLNFDQMKDSDIGFFEEIIMDSPEWEEVELIQHQLSEYIQKYAHLNGEWRVWKLKGQKVAISYHLPKSYSNHKPWIGTLLVRKAERNKGIGKEIISNICTEMKECNQKVIFAGFPIENSQWTSFLTSCSFEQYKLEKDEQGDNYLIMIRPLI
ncbi:GNAT family N-acetyltransferase [Cytobacillus spongiae]|jgi:predicted GNAT family N-acyltransferase|uniref:GNAT family N-acetyltransferase n=1 Tax=Cytobacillus spongiae TaxID=2901381 RepID=UPI001F3D5216|nr:GNAT family N-acetyltransferase [Cytobacillus spongiae]UII57260.1 GNAT family N-acetyltransferase [Cytobacillus spongiae]